VVAVVLASSAVRRGTCQETVPIQAQVVVEAAVAAEPASNAVKMVIYLVTVQKVAAAVELASSVARTVTFPATVPIRGLEIEVEEAAEVTTCLMLPWLCQL